MVTFTIAWIEIESDGLLTVHSGTAGHFVFATIVFCERLELTTTKGVVPIESTSSPTDGLIGLT